MRMNFRPAFLVAVCVSFAACASAPKSATGPAAPTVAVAPEAAGEKWMRTELYFGLAPHEAEGLGWPRRRARGALFSTRK